MGRTRLNPRNIRVRLIAWYIFSLGCVHLFLATVLYQMIASRLSYELDQRVATYAMCLMRSLPQHRGEHLGPLVEEMAEPTALGDDLYVRIADPAGRVLYESSGGMPPAVIAQLHTAAAGSARPATLRLRGGERWRLLTHQVEDQGAPLCRVHVAVALRGVQRALARVAVILIAIVPCVMLLASWGAWWLLNRALAPLQEIVRTARSIQSTNLNQRLSVPKTGDEVQLVGETFNEMIERLDRAFAQMRRFISDASHELRTPLAVLKGEVEMGLKTHTRTDRCEEILEACANEIGRLSRLVETLLLLSNADAENIVLCRRPVQLHDLLEEMAEEARILAEPKRIQVELQHGSQTCLEADAMRLKQLLLNLIDNAVKYTPAGGRITLCHRRVNGHVELSVADTGIGIRPDDVPRIFDRFYRTDTSRSRTDGGYGLGLSICQWIAAAHQGAIRVESTPGHGSVFHVTLPLA